MPPEPPPTTPPPIVPTVPPNPAAPQPGPPPQPVPPQPQPMPKKAAPSSDPSADLLEAGEHLITVIRRHPIGIILLYLEALIGVIAIVAVFAAIGPSALRGISSETTRLILAAVILGLAFLVFFLFVATYVYRQSRFLITDRGLIEVVQTSLFIRKVTRLSFSNVEDVTAEQRGILPTIFNYGTLLVQTAGAMDNFLFIYTPDPNRHADTIIEAREAYAQSLKESGHV